MRRKIFLVDVWLEREKGKNWWGSGVFSLSPPKCFISKIKRKLSERNLIDKWQQWPCAFAHGLVQSVIVYFYFYFFLGLVCRLYTLPFFFFSFDFLGRVRLVALPFLIYLFLSFFCDFLFLFFWNRCNFFF